MPFWLSLLWALVAFVAALGVFLASTPAAGLAASRYCLPFLDRLLPRHASVRWLTASYRYAGMALCLLISGVIIAINLLAVIFGSGSTLLHGFMVLVLIAGIFCFVLIVLAVLVRLFASLGDGKIAATETGINLLCVSIVLVGIVGAAARTAGL